MTPEDKIFAIIGEKGNDLRMTDIAAIEELITECDLDVWVERSGWYYEALALIIQNPAYEGDISPDYLEA